MHTPDGQAVPSLTGELSHNPLKQESVVHGFRSSQSMQIGFPSLSMVAPHTQHNPALHVPASFSAVTHSVPFLSGV
jgi:hypothetical protein